jgi:hypothetical protein
MICMTRTIASSGNFISNQIAEHPLLARLGAFGMVVTLAACSSSGGGGSPSKSEAPNVGVSASGSLAPDVPTSPARSPGIKLPKTWPAPVELGATNCNEGAPIVRQQPHKVEGLLAFYVDGQCNFGAASKPSDPVGFYNSPSFTAAGTAPYEGNNGETVIFDCYTADGQQTGDNRGAASYSSEWVHGTIKNETTEGQPVHAWVSAVNLGQAALAGQKTC